jgi:hypothetical protein
MAVKTWNGSTADWYANNGDNWSPPGDPGPSDDGVINGGEAELESGGAAISVASISVTGGLLATQAPGVTQSASRKRFGQRQRLGAARREQHRPPRGSALRIGGSLSSTSTNGNGISIGNTGITPVDTLTVNRTGGLSNTGAINIEGTATVQSTLDVANAAAGFGRTGVETGSVFL